MDISFEQLKSMVVFAQVVQQGSLTGAAKHIGLSRAVVSYHIKKLETQLGVKLLNRSTRSIALTEAGSGYYERCRIIAEQAETANRQIENLKNEPVGLLKITCPVNVGLQTIVPALNEFKQLYPKIELDVMLTDEVVNIMQEGIDLAIRDRSGHSRGATVGFGVASQQALHLANRFVWLTQIFKQTRAPKQT